MSTNERDTHFAGFAKLLTQELEEYIEWTDDHEKVRRIIAKRAYDLVYHVAWNRMPAHPDTHELIKDIPDMTAWPESE